jgi:hypothetical protein
MSQQVICDNCGTPIDQTHPYYELHGGQVRLDEAGALTQVVPSVTLHFHEEHLPVGVEPLPKEKPKPGKPIYPSKDEPEVTPYSEESKP